eukprot:Seg4957.2 transcript_id=Seg4957.2/GoldUCD/mRNA.D3Y31 product="hypothetical protein" protein_id=Seg4957.2/GoldUCD/D3Y31
MTNIRGERFDLLNLLEFDDFSENAYREQADEAIEELESLERMRRRFNENTEEDSGLTYSGDFGTGEFPRDKYPYVKGREVSALTGFTHGWDDRKRFEIFEPRGYWKEAYQSEMSEFRAFMKYAVGNEAEKEYYTGDWRYTDYNHESENPSMFYQMGYRDDHTPLRERLREIEDCGDDGAIFELCPEFFVRRGADADCVRKRRRETQPRQIITEGIIFDVITDENGVNLDQDARFTSPIEEYESQWDMPWQDTMSHPMLQFLFCLQKPTMLHSFATEETMVKCFLKHVDKCQGQWLCQHALDEMDAAEKGEVINYRMWYKVKGNHSQVARDWRVPHTQLSLREHVIEALDFLSDDKNMWGNVWYNEIRRVEYQDVEGEGFQAALLFTDCGLWTKDEPFGTCNDDSILQSGRTRMFEDNLRREKESRHAVNKQCRSPWDHNFNLRQMIGNLPKGFPESAFLKNLYELKLEEIRPKGRMMGLRQFIRQTRSVASLQIGANNEWKHQIRRIYDVKHAWEVARLPIERIRLINEPCVCGRIRTTEAKRSMVAYVDSVSGEVIYQNEPEHYYAHTEKTRFNHLAMESGNVNFQKNTPAQKPKNFVYSFGSREEAGSSIRTGLFVDASDNEVIYEANHEAERLRRKGICNELYTDVDEAEWERDGCKCRRMPTCGCYEPERFKKLVRDETGDETARGLVPRYVDAVVRGEFDLACAEAYSRVHMQYGLTSHAFTGWRGGFHSMVDDVRMFLVMDVPDVFGKHPVHFTGILERPFEGDWLGPQDGFGQYDIFEQIFQPEAGHVRARARRGVNGVSYDLLIKPERLGIRLVHRNENQFAWTLVSHAPNRGRDFQSPGWQMANKIAQVNNQRQPFSNHGNYENYERFNNRYGHDPCFGLSCPKIPIASRNRAMWPLVKPALHIEGGMQSTFTQPVARPQWIHRAHAGSIARCNRRRKKKKRPLGSDGGELPFVYGSDGAGNFIDAQGVRRGVDYAECDWDVRGLKIGKLDYLIDSDYRCGSSVNDGNRFSILRKYDRVYDEGHAELKVQHIEAMTSSMREVVSINNTYMHYFPMAIKMGYFGVLVNEKDVIRHYWMSLDEEYSKNLVKQHISLREEKMKRMSESQICVTDADMVTFAPFCKGTFLQELIKHLKAELRKMLDSYGASATSMPNHPSCQLVTKRLLNTEKTILFFANMEDRRYGHWIKERKMFNEVYNDIYRC